MEFNQPLHIFIFLASVTLAVITYFWSVMLSQWLNIRKSERPSTGTEEVELADTVNGRKVE